MGRINIPSDLVAAVHIMAALKMYQRAAPTRAPTQMPRCQMPRRQLRPSLAAPQTLTVVEELELAFWEPPPQPTQPKLE